jgi:hypothetical protein
MSLNGIALNRFYFFIFSIICFLIISSCRTGKKLSLQELSNLNDTIYSSYFESFDSKIGIYSYLNSKSDSSYLRIRVSQFNFDSVEYFEFAGKDYVLTLKQKYVDRLDLRHRDTLIFINEDKNSSFFFECLKFEKIFYSIFKEKTDLSIYTDNTPIEFVIEGYNNGHYFRKVFFSILFTVPSNEKLVRDLLTISNAQSRILKINIPQGPLGILNADEDALITPVKERSD